MTVADKPYAARADTLAAPAIRYIKATLVDKPAGAWVLNTELCRHLDVPSNATRPALAPAVAAGLVERSISSGGYMQWRMAQPKARRQKGAPTFSLPDWPPGFVSQFDSVKVADYETRRK